MTTPDPEALGREAAEAVFANLELLKLRLGGGSEAPLDRQLRAGQAAVEALKQILSDVPSTEDP